jgi:hypothetical protein
MGQSHLANMAAKYNEISALFDRYFSAIDMRSSYNFLIHGLVPVHCEQPQLA